MGIDLWTEISSGMPGNAAYSSVIPCFGPARRGDSGSRVDGVYALTAVSPMRRRGPEALSGIVIEPGHHALAELVNSRARFVLSVESPVLVEDSNRVYAAHCRLVSGPG